MSRRKNLQQDNGQTRRDFLWKGACAALTTTGIASTISDLRLIRAAAADTIPAGVGTDYKALVCIFLFGGNDGNNLLVPTDNATYNNQYVPARGVLALPQGGAGGLLPLNFIDPVTGLPNSALAPDGHSYGLHPSCTALQNLFNAGKATIVCNVGTLLAPLTQAQYRNRSVAVPPQLFSHSDQQIEWQTAIEDQQPRTGWGGRSADLLYSQNTSNNVSMNISLSGSNMFQIGDTINEYNVSASSGAVSLNITSTTPGPAQLQALKDLIALNHTNLYESAFAAKMKGAIDNAAVLNAAISATSAANYFNVPFPATSLGGQLKMIARLIEAAPMLGHNRQVFFASVGGFDLHSIEGSGTGAHANLLADVSNSMNALQQAMAQIETRQVNPRAGLSTSVTQFTASDFCRTFPTNTDMGADHAWGNHHIVVGGAVKGNKLYGTYPTLAVNGPDDTSTGRWIPTTSVEQYSASLARWFGVSPGMLNTVFPYLSRFSPGDLGFLA